MRIASFLRVARVALVALFFSSFIHMGDAKKSSCPIPASYLQGLDWTDAKAKCLLVGDGKSAAPCDACFAAFLGSVSKDLTIFQYIDLGQVLADGPAKTLSKVGKACGFLAARLGARSVVISDYVDKLLLNLRDALELNFPEEESDDGGWSRANTAVRCIDWEESIARASGDGPPPAAALDGDSSRTVAPSVADEQFDTIIGTDVLYEWPMVNSLSSCIKQRLAPGGTAYICNAIRDQEMFDALVECIRSKDLLVEVDSLDVVKGGDSDGGWCQDDAYEGGYVFVTISHA